MPKQPSPRNLNIEDITAFVGKISKGLRGGEVFGLLGPLGSGKTTFTQVLAKSLGIKQRVASPTFTLHSSYNGKVPSTGKSVTLHHLDAYRLKDPKQLLTLGVNEFLGKPNAITCIEWADIVKDVLPGNTEYIYLRNERNENHK